MISNINFSFLMLLGAMVFADIPVEDCGSTHGSYSNITLSCSGTDRCILKRNTNVSLIIKFTPSEASDKVTTVVHGVIEGLPVPFPVPNPDACSSLQCPVQSGQSYSYGMTLPIKQAYPKVKVDVKWELQDSNKEDIICVLIPAKIE